MTLSQQKLRLMMSLLTLSFLMSVVCQPTIATCSSMSKTNPSGCCCSNSVSSTDDEQHACCQQESQSNCSDLCSCHHQLPPANTPERNETDKSESENLIATHPLLAIVLGTDQDQKSFQSLLIDAPCSHSVSLNLSLCVWLT